ncbi:MAG: ABC transporter ATP-binding protein [Chloroflexi bacterium]|nr:ABC transporter ATP-binding protein [Chloroflexota bacterium]MCH8337984.1 ABC transporter ATP-binding protein [Chloroflexota bacterium]
MIETHDLAKTYKSADGKEVLAVRGIDLKVRKGEIFSLLGPNGAGKTTTISMISGLVKPTRGDAEIGGFSIIKQPLQAKRLMGVVPQEIALYNTLTGRQNLEFFGKMYGMRGGTLKARVDEMLDFVGLTDRQKDKVENYSGGMKRRLNVGVGLLHKPELIYMDEPTVGIDPQSRRRILDTVKELRDERGMTVLYTTHLMEEAQELSDRVGIMDHGEIIALGTQDELIQRVGEEDLLILKVSAGAVDDKLPQQLKREVVGVTQVLVEQNEQDRVGQLKISAKRGRRALPDVIRLAEAAGVGVQSVEIREPDLEAVFLHLTGRALRD